MPSLKELAENVHFGERTVFDITGEPGARKLTVEMRKLLPEEPRAPKRAESPGRKHEFLSAKSLADYLARYGAKDTVVFADPVNEVISAVLREESVTGFEAVTMKPALHALWKPWADLAGEWTGIEEFAQFIDENRRSILAPEGRDLALSLRQIKASVSVEIQKGRGKNAVNGLVVRTKIQGGGEQTDLVELPESVTIRVPLYVGTAPKEIELDLCLNADASGNVSVLVTAGAVAEARVAAFDEMCKTVQEGVATIGAVVTLGRPSHASWAYLQEPQR